MRCGLTTVAVPCRAGPRARPAAQARHGYSCRAGTARYCSRPCRAVPATGSAVPRAARFGLARLATSTMPLDLGERSGKGGGGWVYLAKRAARPSTARARWRHGPLGHGPLGTTPVAGRAVPAHVPTPRPKHGPREHRAVPCRHGHVNGPWVVVGPLARSTAGKLAR
uniref:Uncharacterized protein n=1 Tax=Oryza sativa subsp. japonica TaxID=39947 RepID=Q69II9_ORYSJ|nr:hypothetical protein [Oryza sativa Japonica Group]BAD36731.1 hypothetical protein [Oryza sativa Japonica Group]